MSTYIFLMVGVVIVLCAVFLALASRSDSKVDAKNVAYQRATLFSPAERSFLGVLDQAIGSEYRVFGKVRVADVLEVGRDTDPAKRRSAFNRISAKHFDFIVCAPDDLRVLCAIELNDASHAKARRRERDDFVAEACKQAQLPLLMLPAKHAYSIDEVRQMVLSALGTPILPPRPAPRPVETPAPDVATSSPEQASAVAHLESAPGACAAEQSEQPAEAGPVIAPACPRCGEPMVKRIGKAGAHAGKAFWGCARFPACRGMQSV